MRLTTDALIIRENNNIGESDRFVTALTRDLGVIRASARGARQLKNRSGAATKLLTYSRLTLFRGRDKYIIDEAEPLQLFLQRELGLSSPVEVREGKSFPAHCQDFEKQQKALLQKALLEQSRCAPAAQKPPAPKKPAPEKRYMERKKPEGVIFRPKNSDAKVLYGKPAQRPIIHMDEVNVDSGKVAEYIESNDTEALYRYLLLTQCNALNSALPVMFERMGGYTEMLLPNNILRQDSVLGHMVSDIPEENWQDAVQIIGWLYQYYNTELKDDTFAQLKKNVKITKERIPAATQLFTPDWIVRYMVENSLGRLWLEGHHNAELRGGWKYYLDETEQEPEVETQLAKLREEYKTIKPEEIKVIDPCMGSGHILVYAFDVLIQIYTSAGWDQREAAQSILKNNLFGLDIDDRAAQLAYFAVMMKARQYDRRLLTRGIQPNIYSIRESNGINRNQLKFFGWSMSEVERNTALTQLEYLLDTFRDAKEYGSILNVDMLDWGLLYRFVGTVDYSDQISMDELNLEGTKDELWTLVEQGAVLAQKYDVVVTNPPYMAVSNAGAKVNDYVKRNFPDSKADLFAVFIERGGQMAKKNGYQAMITQHAWMFLSSFEKLRTKLLAVDIVNMAHLGARAFEEIGGEVVQTTSFVIRKNHIADYKSMRYDQALFFRFRILPFISGTSHRLIF